MKPSEAKKIPEGTVLMGRRFMHSWPRIVVSRVEVKGPQTVLFHDEKGQEHHASEMEHPSPLAEEFWARQAAQRREEEEKNAEWRRVTVALGTRPLERGPVFGPAYRDYTVTLTRPQALVVVEQLEANVKLRAALDAVTSAWGDPEVGTDVFTKGHYDEHPRRNVALELAIEQCAVVLEQTKAFEVK
jgi:hypothetical protein